MGRSNSVNKTFHVAAQAIAWAVAFFLVSSLLFLLKNPKTPDSLWTAVMLFMMLGFVYTDQVKNRIVLFTEWVEERLTYAYETHQNKKSRTKRRHRSRR